MRRIESVYRHVLYEILDRHSRDFLFKQKALSSKCGISISTVNYALKPLEQMNAIEKKPMGFRVLAPKKILYYWASIRKLRKDIVYQTRVHMPVNEMEKSLSPVVFTAYSAYKFLFNDTPADYSEVWAYGDESVSERFEKKEGRPNLIILRMDDDLKSFKSTPIAQIFVDLWNTGTWYADDFVKALEVKINGVLE